MAVVAMDIDRTIEASQPFCLGIVLGIIIVGYGKNVCCFPLPISQIWGVSGYILFHNVTLSIVRPTRPWWVNTVPCYCCPFLYLRMCLSTVTERVPRGRAGPEFVPVPGNFLGPRASTGLARFMKFWVIEILKKSRLYHTKSTDTDAILVSLLDWCADVSFSPCFVCVLCM